MSNSSAGLRRQTIKINQLSVELKKEMFELFATYYKDVEYERFLSDLKEKTHSFLFFEKESNKLMGFSTIFRKEIPSIAPGKFLFSGDTVIHEKYRGSKGLQKSFFWFILISKLKTPFHPLYWMLMSKGVKTYLLMRKNFKASFPNLNHSTPLKFQDVLDRFYQSKFPEDFLKEKGLITFKTKMGSVKSDKEVMAEGIRINPDAQFFFNKNPHWENGEELACVAEIRFRDFFYHIFKFFIPLLK
jgi:hypothetical protein